MRLRFVFGRRHSEPNLKSLLFVCQLSLVKAQIIPYRGKNIHGFCIRSRIDSRQSHGASFLTAIPPRRLRTLETPRRSANTRTAYAGLTAAATRTSAGATKSVAVSKVFSSTATSAQAATRTGSGLSLATAHRRQMPPASLPTPARRMAYATAGQRCTARRIRSRCPPASARSPQERQAQKSLVVPALVRPCQHSPAAPAWVGP
jgi:hypothetical protein